MPIVSTKSAATWLFWAIGGMLLLLMGMAVGIYGAVFGDKPLLLLAAPLVVLMGVLLFSHTLQLFYGLLLFRCSLDPVLDSARFGSFSLGALLNLLVVASAFLLFLKHEKKPLMPVVWLWFGPVFVIFLGCLYSPDVFEAFRRWIAILSYFSVFMVAVILVRQGQLASLFRVILLSSLLPLIYGFYQMAVGALMEGRLAATFSHPNIYAFYSVLVVFVVLTLWKGGVLIQDMSRFERWLSLGVLPLLLISIVLTQTRSAWLVLVLLGVVYGVLVSRVILVYMVVGLLAAACLPAVQDRVMDMFSGNEVVQYAKLNSFAWRKYIWESGLSWMEPSHYFFGYGIGAFRYYSPDFFPLSFGVHFAAHNVFVERFFDGGAIAVGVFAAFFIVQFIAAWRLVKKNRMAGLIYWGLILSYLTLNFSDNVVDYLAYNWYFWALAGVFFCLSRQSISTKTTAV